MKSPDAQLHGHQNQCSPTCPQTVCGPELKHVHMNTAGEKLDKVKTECSGLWAF